MTISRGILEQMSKGISGGFLNNFQKNSLQKKTEMFPKESSKHFLKNTKEQFKKKISTEIPAVIPEGVCE